MYRKLPSWIYLGRHRTDISQTWICCNCYWPLPTNTIVHDLGPLPRSQDQRSVKNTQLDYLRKCVFEQDETWYSHGLHQSSFLYNSFTSHFLMQGEIIEISWNEEENLKVGCFSKIIGPSSFKPFMIVTSHEDYKHTLRSATLTFTQGHRISENVKVTFHISQKLQFWLRWNVEGMIFVC